MNDRQSKCDTNDSWSNRMNWATDEDWVRAAANLEAETGVDILIGADLGNNLDLSGKICSSQIDVNRLAEVIQEGFTDLLTPEELMILVTETHTYISNQVARLKFDRSQI
jgi:hypothetical protein